MTWRALSISLYVEVQAPASMKSVKFVRAEKAPLVGRCRLTVSKPVLKAPVVSAFEAET